MREETLHTSEREPKNARDFLEKLKNREAIEGDSRIAVVVAHQDDESIAFGAQIQRFPNCLMVHVTDGAPANPKEWKTKGFKNQAEYAEVRNTEVNTALDRARHTGKRVSLNVPDQQAALNLTQNAEALALFFAENNIRFVLTHAYEGGHPDHDATAFAVHTAQKLLEKENIPISVIEAPLYRMKGD